MNACCLRFFRSVFRVSSCRPTFESLKKPFIQHKKLVVRFLFHEFLSSSVASLFRLHGTLPLARATSHCSNARAVSTTACCFSRISFSLPTRDKNRRRTAIKQKAGGGGNEKERERESRARRHAYAFVILSESTFTSTVHEEKRGEEIYEMRAWKTKTWDL